MAVMEIEVRKVVTKKDLKKFVLFQFSHYQGNPYWCPPLVFDELNTLRKDKNPAFEYCEAEYWLAYRAGKPVGRIAGIINHKANQRWNESMVRFGWIEFIDDAAVSEKLIETVSSWGAEKGMTGIQGPLGFTDMDPEGMLIEGFEEISSMSAIYNYPYYPDHMTRMGFCKGADWVQFDIKVPPEIPDKVGRSARIVAEKYNLRLLQAKKAKELRPYARKMFTMMNDAFDDLYGYSQIGVRQMDMYTRQYFGFIRPEFVSIILDENDDVIGFGITLPELNQALRRCNGRLFPFGFLHLLRAMKRNDTIHMYLIGVRPDYHQKGALAMIYNQIHEAARKFGITRATTHAQLEDNQKAISIWKNYESRVYIRRRCWERSMTDHVPHKLGS